MKIALIVSGGVDRSGTERVIPALLWMIERLAKRHTVHVFALRQEPLPGHWTLFGAHVHNIGNRGAWRRRLFTAFRHQQRDDRFSVIHGFGGGPGAYATLLGWRFRLPVILQLTGGEFVTLPGIGYGATLSPRGRAIVRLATMGARRVTVASEPMMRLAGAHGLHAEVVPLGVALDRWPPAEPHKRDTTKPAHLLHIGDLTPVKDHETLLAAALALHRAGVEFILDLAGVDTMNGIVQQNIERLGLAGFTHWHGALSRENVRSLVDRSDILIVSSRHEAGPLAFLEAAIAGVPTVGTSVGHVAEFAPDAAVAVPIGNASALAREIGDLLADETRRLAIAREAQRRAMVYDADYTAAQFERIYEELMDGK